MNNEIRALLICLIDEVKFSQSPSELTVEILLKYRSEYKFVDEYLTERERLLEGNE